MKTLAEIEADIKALTDSANKLREQAKSKARPRLAEIKSQVEVLIAEAIQIAKNNGIQDFDIVLKPRAGSGYYNDATTITYSYGSWTPRGEAFDTSSWESSSANC